MRNDTFDLKALETAKYRGIWYGAHKRPISVKTLLDNVIKQGGRGFGIRSSRMVLGNCLKTQLFLVDEENRGRFRLSEDGIAYLRKHLRSDYWQMKLICKEA